MSSSLEVANVAQTAKDVCPPREQAFKNSNLRLLKLLAIPPSLDRFYLIAPGDIRPYV
jgi:hypothetical protein